MFFQQKKLKYISIYITINFYNINLSIEQHNTTIYLQIQSTLAF